MSRAARSSSSRLTSWSGCCRTRASTSRRCRAACVVVAGGVARVTENRFDADCGGSIECGW